MPWLGSLVALATLGAAVRRKGVARGALDTALDMMPIVGALKNALEVMRGTISFLIGQRLSRRASPYAERHASRAISGRRRDQAPVTPSISTEKSFARQPEQVDAT